MAYNAQMYMPPNYMPPQFQMPQPRMVEVVPVETVEEAGRIQVQMGGTVLAIAKDDSFIAVKSVGMNGNDSFNVFDKRPPAPPAPVFDPTAFVTKEELEARLATISRSVRVKKEAPEE